MKIGNMHTHTTFCDGRNDPESIVIKAIGLGFDTLGFSGHSELPGCDNWCMNGNRAELYRKEIKRLAEKYRGWINIYCGVEQDYYSPTSTECYDFVIGSVHCFNINSKLLPVDADTDFLKKILDGYFGGSFLTMAEAYFELESDVVRKTHADIIGHFDLITKFNKLGYFFDESNEKYISLAKKAIDELKKTGKPFELNTGAMARGYLDRAYPAPYLIDYIKSKGIKLILTSDCHDLNYLDFAFDKYVDIADAMTLEEIRKM